MRLKLFIFLVAADQFFKFLSLKFFHPVFNRGIAFGLGENVPILLIIIAYLFLALWILRHKSGFGEILLLAGGSGNILDRLTAGNIVDWISLGSLWFNLADAYISFGTILIFSHIVIPAKAGIYINSYLYRFRVKRFDRHELTAEWHGMTVKRKVEIR